MLSEARRNRRTSLSDQSYSKRSKREIIQPGIELAINAFFFSRRQPLFFPRGRSANITELFEVD
jgi:hypothetical protein